MKHNNINKTEHGFSFNAKSKFLEFLIKLFTKNVEYSGRVMGYLPKGQKVKKNINIHIEYIVEEKAEEPSEINNTTNEQGEVRYE